MAGNAFTVDVEDYFQVSAFAQRTRPEDWSGFESRVAVGTYRILRLLAERNIRGTFFVLGWVADRHPELVRDIHRDGHEVGTHSYWHRLVYRQSPAEFREDLQKSMDAIEQAIGERPVAYRAPSFSITRQSEWALDILVEEGIRIDSSIFPIRHDRYGIPTINPAPHPSPLGRTGLWEMPPSVLEVGRLRIPIAGGGYFRIFPEGLTRRLQTRLLNQGRRPLVFYIHPWEVDPEQPRMPAAALTRFRHYRNLHATESRLARLLDRVEFGSLGDLVSDYQAEMGYQEDDVVAASRTAVGTAGFASGY